MAGQHNLHQEYQYKGEGVQCSDRKTLRKQFRYTVMRVRRVYISSKFYFHGLKLSQKRYQSFIRIEYRQPEMKGDHKVQKSFHSNAESLQKKPVILAFSGI